MKTKSIPNIKSATLEAFNSLPDEFRGFQLARLVKIITRRRFIYEDSCFRKLRKLKAEGKLNYKLGAEKSESLYQKLWKQYKSVKREGERKAIFYPIRSNT